jgi:predicted DNA repair protein MutK
MQANPAAGVYGLITVGALLSAESARRQTYPETVEGVLIALLIYWLAHSYSEFTAQRLAEGTAVKFGDLGRTMLRELFIVVGALVPLGTVVIWWIAGGRLTNAVEAAVWASAVMVVVVEAIAGVGAGLKGWEFVGQLALGVVIGLLILALNFVLH